MYRVHAKVRPVLALDGHCIAKKCCLLRVACKVLVSEEFQRVPMQKNCVLWLRYLNFCQVLKMTENKEYFRDICFFIPEKQKFCWPELVDRKGIAFQHDNTRPHLYLWSSDTEIFTI